ncbi:MAG: hypothetical protein KBC84_04425 [Proteobacteria bacterium]|nr:hypothetical protein [Pseudomonadota bacterium]
MKTNNQTILNNSEGKAISWAILFNLALGAGYYFGGKEYIYKMFPGQAGMIATLAIGVVGFFILGCALQLSLSGKDFNKPVVDKLQEKTQSMIDLINESEVLIHKLENDLGKCSIKITPRGVDCLGTARRIVRALEERVIQINEKLFSGRSSDLFEADRLLNTKLVVSESPIDALLDSKPIPALALEDCTIALNRIFEEIDLEKRRAA